MALKIIASSFSIASILICLFTIIPRLYKKHPDNRILWICNHIHNNEDHNLLNYFRICKFLKKNELSKYKLSILDNHSLTEYEYRNDSGRLVFYFTIDIATHNLTHIYYRPSFGHDIYVEIWESMLQVLQKQFPNVFSKELESLD